MELENECIVNRPVKIKIDHDTTPQTSDKSLRSTVTKYGGKSKASLQFHNELKMNEPECPIVQSPGINHIYANFINANISQMYFKGFGNIHHSTQSKKTQLFQKDFRNPFYQSKKHDEKIEHLRAALDLASFSEMAFKV